MRNIVLGLAGLAIVLGTVFYASSFSQTKSASKESNIGELTTNSYTDDSNKTSRDYFYPIPNYEARIEERSHGQYFKPGDKVNAACGKPFLGFHAGDDLETNQNEIESEVPVTAIAKGKILQIGFVSGYGGLIVQSANLNGQPVTIYYGHMDLGSIPFKPGDEVKAGETLGNLGDECSTETDDARKHLHFAIRRGSDIDVRGYVPTEQVLSNWLNPRSILQNLNASSPQ